MLLDVHPLAGATYTVGGGPGGGTHAFGQNWQSSWAADLMVPAGTPVYAPIDALVVKAGGLGAATGRFAGMRVGLEGVRVSVYLAHLASVAVKPKQRVEAGALVGHSGQANGVDHLHVGVTRGGYYPADERRGFDPRGHLAALAVWRGGKWHAHGPTANLLALYGKTLHLYLPARGWLNGPREVVPLLIAIARGEAIANVARLRWRGNEWTGRRDVRNVARSIVGRAL